ncbi:MAG: MinD/ParA family protein [Clostridia bacterium]|nr:MinD/ParA family protein [Clostridia bacterium]
MEDQAARLREKARERRKASAARVITVTGGKGGVGKTNFTTNLGVCLAGMGKRVILLDADLGMANIDVLMGLTSMYSLYDVLEGDKDLSEIIVTCPNGVKLIPGGSGFNQLAYMNQLEKKKIEESLSQVTAQHDFVLIDTAAGLSRDVLAFIAASNEVIVVITPEPTSITDAYGMIKAVSRFRLNHNIHILINMAVSSSEAGETADKITNVARAFLETEVNLLGYIQRDDSVVKAVKRQTPFLLLYPNSRASRQLTKAADNLVKGKGLREIPKSGFVSRIMRYFA